MKKQDLLIIGIGSGAGGLIVASVAAQLGGDCLYFR